MSPITSQTCKRQGLSFRWWRGSVTVCLFTTPCYFQPYFFVFPSVLYYNLIYFEHLLEISVLFKVSVPDKITVSCVWLVYTHTHTHTHTQQTLCISVHMVLWRPLWRKSLYGQDARVLLMLDSFFPYHHPTSSNDLQPSNKLQNFTRSLKHINF
jgi:hypothetical protein